MKEKDGVKDNYNVKINIFGNENDLKINSEYILFRKNICNLVNIPQEYFNTILLSYLDEDNDNIQLLTEEDYEIFLQQVKEGKASRIKLEINENYKNEIIENQDKKEPLKDSQKINDINIHNDINKNNINDFIENNNNNNINHGNKININNINYNINNFDIDDYNNNKSNQNIKNNKNVNINDIIFNYPCNYCKKEPIVCIMYYCPGCQLYSCDECIKNIDETQHNIYIIESNEQLINIQNEEKNETEINRIVIEDIQSKDKEEMKKKKH